MLFDIDCEYQNHDVKTVTIKNDQCELVVTYDQNFDIQKTKKSDMYNFWLEALFMSFGVGVFCGAVSCLAALGVLVLLRVLFLGIRTAIQTDFSHH